MINEPIRLDPRELAAGRYRVMHSPVTLAEQCLLFISIVSLPLQNYIPTVAGMSFSFLLFVVLIAYVIVNRLRILGVTWCHPVFIVTCGFVIVSVALEFSSPLSNYQQSMRFLEMAVGMLCVAVLCRDRSALTAGMYGYITIALWTSVVLYLTGYDAIQGMAADDFSQAEKVRLQAYGEKPMGANINRLAHVCAQGALVAFAFSLSDKWRHLRGPLLGVVIICLLGALLTMSRGAGAVLLVGFAVMLAARGFRQGKALILVSILGMSIYAVVPDAVWSRMVFTTEVGKSGNMESRAKLYTNALNRLPEYIVAGVGAGNFSSKWAFENGFSSHRTSPDGKSTEVLLHVPHNALIQLTIYWGILGLSMFLLIVWCVYRLIPLHCGRDELSLALLAILVSLGAFLLYSNDFSDKAFAVGIGMLIGARQWIWPSGVVPPVEGSRYPSAPYMTVDQDRQSR